MNSIWDNGNVVETEKYTILKGNKVFILGEKGLPLVDTFHESYIDAAWMDRERKRVEYKDMPMEVREAIDRLY